MTRFRVLAGVALWLFGIGVAWCYLDQHPAVSEDIRRTTTQLCDYSTGNRRVVTLELGAACDVRPGDPIFAAAEGETIRQIGEIAGVEKSGSESRVRALFYASAPIIKRSDSIAYHRASGSMQWVLQTMLPESKRTEVAGLVREAFHEHHAELVELLQPVVQDAVQDAMEVVEADLPAAMQKRRGDFERIADRYQEDMIQREVVPLLRAEVWPVVRRHVEPTVNHVSQEVLDRASLWRFGWRFAYDKLPLTDRNLMHNELRRFLQEEAVPVLENHTDEFITMQQRIFSDVARDPEVRQMVCRNLGRVVQDPEVHALAWEIIQDTVIDNPRMKQVLKEHWQSPRTQAAMAQASRKLEPTVVRIGELLFGSPEDGLTPEFAHVLRNQILGKDRRWLVLQSGGATASHDAGPLVLRVSRGTPDAVHPFVAQATEGMWN